MNEAESQFYIQIDPIWEKHAKEIHGFTDYFAGVKTNEAKIYYANGLTLDFNSFSLSGYPRLQEYFKSILALLELDVALEVGEHSGLKDQTNQQIIIRALARRLDDIFKSKYAQNDLRNFTDYQPFYILMNEYLAGLKTQGSNSVFPDFTGSVALTFTKAVNEVYKKDASFDLSGVRKKIKDNFTFNKHFHREFVGNIPKIGNHFL